MCVYTYIWAVVRGEVWLLFPNIPQTPAFPMFPSACILIHYQTSPLPPLLPTHWGREGRAQEMEKRPTHASKTNPSLTLIAPDIFKCGFTGYGCSHVFTSILLFLMLCSYMYPCVCTCSFLRTCTLCMTSSFQI